MYFQKLENLYDYDAYKNNKILVDAFDEWLAFVPKSYKDRLTPDMFQNSEKVRMNDTLNLFEEAVKIKLMKHRYMLCCNCGYVKGFYETEIEAIRALSDYYDNFDDKCEFCNEHQQLSTDNILIIYKLVEEPKFISSKKKIPFLYKTIAVC